jgi:hypothetical protein
MSDELQLQEIPRYGNAGVAFLGVEVGDTYLLIASVFIGLIAGTRWGMSAYIGIPAGGYFITKLYLDWKSSQLPGSLQSFLFSTGISGYSNGLIDKNVIYHGDSIGINKGFDIQEEEMLTAYLQAKENNGLV